MIILFQIFFILMAIYFSGMALAEYLIEPAKSDLIPYSLIAVVCIALGVGLPNIVSYLGGLL